MDNADNLLRLLAANVRQFRLARGLSQEELSHRAGIDVRYLGGIERAQRNPSIKVVASIADSLAVSVLDLLRNYS